MRRSLVLILVLLVLPVAAMATVVLPEPSNKPEPQEILEMLKTGNKRFVAGKATNPHSDPARIQLGGKENQGKHALATVITCSDSRCPVERIFDVGIMDVFVIRVAGNVMKTDEAGSIEYGLAHVKTPVLVILGHTQCGAVTAVTEAVTGGGGHGLERNIPPLVAPIAPAVKRAIQRNPQLRGQELILEAIVENVWQDVEDLFMQSPAVRQMVRIGQVKIAPAIYDVATGRVHWLPEDKVMSILNDVEQNPKRAMNAMADEEHGAPAQGGGHDEPAAAHGETQAAAHAAPAAPAKPSVDPARVDALEVKVAKLGSTVGMSLWAFPALVVLLTGGSIFFTFRRTRAPGAPAAPAEKPKVH